MKMTDETQEFVYSVSPDGSVEHVILHGIELDWNDGDLNKITKKVCDKKPRGDIKRRQKRTNYEIVDLV